MYRMILIALAVALMAGPACAAFKDVPTNHWAYEAIEKAVKSGIVQGFNNEFFGNRPLNRYQMAVVVARLLEKIGERGGAAPSGDALKQLEALVTEFADELALLNVKVGKLEETVNAMGKGTTKAVVAEGGEALKFHGIFKNWYVMPDTDKAAGDLTAENERFEVRNAILSFEYKFTDDIKLRFSNEFANAYRPAEPVIGPPAVPFYQVASTDSARGILDMRVDIKMPNSENVFAFGSFRPEITAYGYKPLNELDFVAMPIAYNFIGVGGNGIGWQNGFMVDFKGKKDDKMSFKLGLFNGGTDRNTGVADDEDKALMLAVNFKGTSKLCGGIWYYSDEETGVGAPEFDGMGLHLAYNAKSFKAMLEYMSGDYNPAAGTDEFDSFMVQFIVPMQKNKTDFLVRMEQVDYDDGTAGDGGDWDRMSIGFRWYMNTNAVWQLEYWSDEFNGGNTAGGAYNEPSTIALQLMTFF